MDYKQQQNNSGGLEFRCIACGDSPHTIHMDGNCKLYRYANAGRQVHTNNAVSFFMQSIVLKTYLAFLL